VDILVIRTPEKQKPNTEDAEDAEEFDFLFRAGVCLVATSDG
jgi:hypothetical protein